MGREMIVTDWMGYWAFLANRNADQWARISQDIRKRRYSPKRMLSDTLCFWTDATMGWMSAARGEETPSTVMFQISTLTDCAKKTIGPFFRPSLPSGDPEVQWFGRLDAGRSTSISPLRGDYLRVKWLRKDPSLLQLRLRVPLTIIPGPPPKTIPTPIDPGTYGALVNVGDEPLALVYINVK